MCTSISPGFTVGSGVYLYLYTQVLLGMAPVRCVEGFPDAPIQSLNKVVQVLGGMLVGR